MKRDWEIIRQILLSLEEAETANTVLNANALQPLPEQEVAYNMRLLAEAGLIEASILNSRRGDNAIAAAMARRLTYAGHDFLDVIRHGRVWGKTKETIQSKGLDLTFDLIVQVGRQVIAAIMGS